MNPLKDTQGINNDTLCKKKLTYAPPCPNHSQQIKQENKTTCPRVGYGEVWAGRRGSRDPRTFDSVVFQLTERHCSECSKAHRQNFSSRG